MSRLAKAATNRQDSAKASKLTKAIEGDRHAPFRPRRTLQRAIAGVIGGSVLMTVLLTAHYITRNWAFGVAEVAVLVPFVMCCAVLERDKRTRIFESPSEALDERQVAQRHEATTDAYHLSMMIFMTGVIVGFMAVTNEDVRFWEITLHAVFFAMSSYIFGVMPVLPHSIHALRHARDDDAQITPD